MSGNVTVNHNNAPISILNNTVFDVYFVARTYGDRLGFQKISFKMIYPPINYAPKFVSIPRDFTIIVDQLEQDAGYENPIEMYQFPSIMDIERDNVSIGTYGTFPTCNCVDVNIVQGPANVSKIWFDFNKTAITQKDVGIYKFTIELKDTEYLSSFLKTSIQW